MNNTEIYSYPQSDLDSTVKNTTAPLKLFHAPFSELHIESLPSEDSVALNLGQASDFYIPKSKEIWEAIEKGFSSPVPNKTVDKTNTITLHQTLADAGINLDKLNKGLEQFIPLLEPDMFTESRYLTLDNYRYILSRLDITIRDNAPCNTDSNLRKYVSEILYNAMTKNN